MVSIASFGGGVNSTAMLIGLWQRGDPIDAVLFADTGGEKPHTYDFIADMDRWLRIKGLPRLTVVKTRGQYSSLEDNCLKKNMLPSLAYGFKGCSQKYKIRPQNYWSNRWPPAKEAWKAGEKVVKYIGIDAAEERRAKIKEDDKYIYRYPLIDWGWDRDDCITAIKEQALPMPSKSSCFFCPASTTKDIRELAERYPDLALRAIQMERNAELTSVKGLGRRFSWEEFLRSEIQQGYTHFDTTDIACMCYDGDDD
jgi:hypothetical protein